MNQHLLSALRKELENSFGRKIVSSRDCLQLVDDIYQKTGYTINSNTLRRFFGLVKTAYTASPSTVTILSKYCGFGSIDEIENIATANPGDSTINKEEVLHYLTSLFKNLPTVQEHNPILESLVRQTIIFLERNPSLIDRFQREVAKTAAGQYYYYELAVNMDRLNDYYGDGLRHYVRAAATDQAKIFMHSLMVLRYWLTGNTDLLEKHMVELQALPVNHHYPSHISGRLIAARLYHANARNEAIEKVLSDASKYQVAILSSRGNTAASHPDFELAVCEALILTGHSGEAQEYIRRGKSFFTGLRNIDRRNPFSFWEAVLNSKKNRPVAPVAPGRKLPGQDVNQAGYPLARKYFHLLLLQQAGNAKSSQAVALVTETGFTKLHPAYTRKVENL